MLAALLVFLVHGCAAVLSRDGIVQDDAESYVLIARNLAAGDGFVFHPGSQPTSWRAPVYPAFLASMFFVSGGSLLAVRLVQAAIWGLICIVVFHLARQMWEPRTSLGVALVVGLYPEFVGLTPLLWSETLFIFVFLVATLALLRLGQNPTPWMALVFGLACGVATLTRPAALGLLPVACLFIASRRSAGMRKGLLLLLTCIAAAAVIAPWTIRNYRVHGDPLLVTSNIGKNLYIGHAKDTPIPFSWRKLYKLDSDPIYQRIVRDHPTQSSRSRALTAQAIQNIREQPLRTMVLTVTKLFDLWLPDFFVSSNVRAGSYGLRWRPLWPGMLAITVTLYLVLMMASLAGLWAWRQHPLTPWVLAIVIVYSMGHAAVYGASRYHLPLLPLLFVFGVPHLVATIRQRLPWLHRTRPDERITPRMLPDSP